ncbi:MAG TPA: beta-ketoacyl-[acyl-carrier-protein] synthase family protein [bacterium]|nr:beta-ketoacyl-[acyl-carrier-protein] synthase family protein [bacterium]
MAVSDPIVVTGIGMVTPLGKDAETTWKGLFGDWKPQRPLLGREWDAFQKPQAAHAHDFKYSEKLIQRDRSLRMAVSAAEEAWENARLFRVPPNRIATTFSSSKGGILSLLNTAFDPTVNWDFLKDFFPHAGGQLLSQWFGFSGPTLSVSSACSTGLGSLALGARLLVEGEADAVLTGSSEASIHPLIYAAFQNMGILTHREEGPAPFDSNRDGFLMGEGSAVIVLETERSARKRKSPILARLSGCALGADAHGLIAMEPHGLTIVPLIQKVLSSAGLKAPEIGYINAHGTGTKMNDEVECQALQEVFAGYPAWISSTKGATGHLLGAAGSVEAALSLMALAKGELPATRNLENPDPLCRVRHVEKGGIRQKVDHVLSLSYGFGGQLGAVIFSKV